MFLMIELKVMNGFEDCMRTLYVTALFFLLLILAGCGSIGIEKQRINYKSGVTKVSTLEVPPDLTVPAFKEQHIVSGGGGGDVVASFSDFVKGGQGLQGNSGPVVLPEIKNIQLERSGNQRWLAVTGKVENVWPLVKEFWQEQGFNIKTDNPVAGIIETDWAEREAKVQEKGLSKLIGKVFEQLHSSGEQDMYRTRLERGKDGNTTEIYISHRGMQEVPQADKNGFKWSPRPNDPELEASMLQQLMIKLGGGTENYAKVGQKNNLQEVAGKSSLGSSNMPKLQEIDGNNVIILNEPFDKSWRKVGLALDQAGIEVQDKDRVKGIYFVNANNVGMAKEKSWLNNMMFWRSENGADSAKNSPRGAARYQVTVRENSDGSEVGARNQQDGKDQATQRIIETLYKQLSK